MTTKSDFYKESIVKYFSRVLDSFESGEEYQKKPPQGPPEELASLSDDELASLQTNFSEIKLKSGQNYDHLKLIEAPAPAEVPFPTLEVLADINVCAIDGSNQKVEKDSFYFILGRASIINFRYSTKNLKPYFYTVNKDATAVVWVDGKIFKEKVRLNTKEIKIDDKSILHYLRDNESNKPYLVRYNPDKTINTPSAHALGWAVKLQQALELQCLAEIKTDLKTVCIKDGPLFSTSISIADVIDGYKPIYSWNDQVLVACSKRIDESTLLVEALLRNIELRNFYFPGQNITEQTIKSLAKDSLIVTSILKPGFRTPFFEAIPVARKDVVQIEKRLMPLACYYLSRNRPHTIIRLEIPKFMWEQNKPLVDEAIKTVAWQHELGHKAPLVQLVADQRCQLAHEKLVLDKQTEAIMYRNNLTFPEKY